MSSFVSSKLRFALSFYARIVRVSISAHSSQHNKRFFIVQTVFLTRGLSLGIGTL